MTLFRSILMSALLMRASLVQAAPTDTITPTPTPSPTGTCTSSPTVSPTPTITPTPFPTTAATPLPCNTVIKVAGDGACPSVPGYAGDGGLASAAVFNQPYGLWGHGHDTLYVADTKNNCIRRIDLNTGTISRVAGTTAAGGTGDGASATAATLNWPLGLWVDKDANVYFADFLNNRIRRVDAASGIITTLVGNGTAGDLGEGVSITANQEIQGPMGVAGDDQGHLYFSDNGNNKVKQVDLATGILTTVAGSGPSGGTGSYGGDGAAATAANLNYPLGLWADGAGLLYICDNGNNRVRRVDLNSGLITTFAGGGSGGPGGLATAYNLQFPTSVTGDLSGQVFIAEAQSRVDSVSLANGVLQFYAGNLADTAGCGLDGGPMTYAQFYNVIGMWPDNMGGLYLSDSVNNRVRAVHVCATPVVRLSNLGKVVLAPVPVKQGRKLQLFFDRQPASVDWKTYNTAGEKVSQGSFSGPGPHAIDTGVWAPGVYLVRLVVQNADGSGETTTQKIVILGRQ